VLKKKDDSGGLGSFEVLSGSWSEQKVDANEQKQDVHEQFKLCMKRAECDM
jgi:hypothetical protein